MTHGGVSVKVPEPVKLSKSETMKTSTKVRQIAPAIDPSSPGNATIPLQPTTITFESDSDTDVSFIILDPNGEPIGANIIANSSTYAFPSPFSWSTSSSPSPTMENRNNYLHGTKKPTTREEKMALRKMRNRHAAQMARERKRARMDELEAQVRELQQKNQELLRQNEALRQENSRVNRENSALRENTNNQRFKTEPAECVTSEEECSRTSEASVSAVSPSFESAEFINGPQQKEQERTLRCKRAGAMDQTSMIVFALLCMLKKQNVNSMPANLSKQTMAAQQTLMARNWVRIAAAQKQQGRLRKSGLVAVKRLMKAYLKNTGIT